MLPIVNAKSHVNRQPVSNYYMKLIIRLQEKIFTNADTLHLLMTYFCHNFRIRMVLTGLFH